MPEPMKGDLQAVKFSKDHFLNGALVKAGTVMKFREKTADALVASKVAERFNEAAPAGTRKGSPVEAPGTK